MSTKSLLVGKKPVLEAIKNQPEQIDKILISTKIDVLDSKEFFTLAQQSNILIQKVPIEKINKITRTNHQGVIAFLKLVPYYDVQSVLDLINDKGETPFFLTLDGITDVRNIGAIIRSAYAYGVHAIIIPENGIAPLREDAMKTSAGSLANVVVCRVKYIHQAIKILQLNGIKIIGTDLKANIPLTKCDFNLPCAILMGGEDTGVDENLLKLCDERIKIPIQNKLDSLNVSVATGICLYTTFLNRNPNL